jgi:hypothetical protein
MASSRCEDLNRDRLGTLQHASQITDHASGPFRQSQLDRLVQLLDDVTEPPGNLKDGYLTYRC